ncbi:MAG: SDR family NAD(P)-dependent oxidoreductase [Flammeovirgaceae bacterium]
MRISNSEKNRLKKKYGPWAVVTGASSGIGKELAQRLAEAGINVFLTARRVELLEEIANALQSSYQVETQICEADISTPAGVQLLIEHTNRLSVGLFVAAAGFGTSGLFLASNLEDELNMLQVNCGALLSLTHHFSQRFAEQKKGGIILLSSMVGFQGVPYAAHYAATKAYVQSLAEGLAEELKRHHVDVLAAAPGPVLSGFAERANMQMGMALKPADIGVPILKALGRKTTVLPGFLTKFLVTSLRTVPRWGKVKIMRIVMGGMTKHQRNLQVE